MDRKGMKANARKAYKRHYWMIVVICLFASVFGVAYSSSTWSVNASSPSATVQEDGTAQSDNVSKVLENLLVGDESQARRQVEHNQEQIVQNDTNAMMGRKRGVFASLLNSFSSGSVILSMADAANSIVHNDGVAVAVPIVVSLAVYLFVWLFVQQTYRVVMMRMLLEGRTYDKLPVSRFLYPITTRKWLSMAKVMLLENVFLFLWTFTIIGAFIKPYSYRMVPYIVAENPNIGAREAISLSRRMMKGHKWECFVADLSFLGWWLLNLFTLGLSGIFYSNGYNAAFFVEYYVLCADCPRIRDWREASCSATNTCTARPPLRHCMPRMVMLPKRWSSCPAILFRWTSRTVSSGSCPNGWACVSCMRGR